MPDEEIDKLIRDAASQHHPPYDDDAWGKMEILLDEHLPQKKDRKKPIFFLLLFLLLSGTIFFIVKNTGTQKELTAKNKTHEKTNTAATDFTTSVNSNKALSNNTDSNTTALNQKTPTIKITATNTTDKNVVPSVKSTVVTNGGMPFVATQKKSYKQKGRFAIKVKSPTAISNDEDNITIKKAGVIETTDNSMIQSSLTKPTDFLTVDNNSIKPDSIIAKNNTVDTSKASTKTLAQQKDTSITVAKEKKKEKSFANKFAIVLAAGVDVSYVSLNNTGKLKALYGAGISYALAKNITLSSGLYVSNKVYTANPTQYKFNGYTNPRITSIDANCKIYEIPLIVRYNFKGTKTHNWFTGIGLSSFIMKKEDYLYKWTSPVGLPVSYLHSVSNKNNHYFSVLTLSGGYQYKVSTHISLLAEPYLKIPLAGVGEGEVKLKGAGILATAVIMPFVIKKKKEICL